MSDLKEIIEDAFIEGWGSLECVLNIHDTPKRERTPYLDSFLGGYQNEPPLLTREIFEEILAASLYCTLAIDTKECKADIICDARINELLTKYNLEPKDE